MKIIERNSQRVLTSLDLAEAFGTDLKRINYNFAYNKNRYEEGKHFFAITGEERKEFIYEHEIHASLKKVHTLYLWTEKGAFLHAKSLNTDEAWNAYSKLVDDYFKKVEEQQSGFSQLSPQLQVLILMENKQRELEESQLKLQAQNEELRQDMKHLSLVVDNEVWITDHQKADIQEAVKRRVGKLKKEAIDAHFQGVYSDLKTFFNVPKYDKISRKDFEQAMDFISSWYPKRKEQTT